ncbi:MAG: hypothetical protein Q9213_007462 [Squamulea squamosa]
MFLWVFFQLDDLCEAPSDALIRETLRNLPNGLSETYERISKKICRDAIKRVMVQKICKWIICARRPLGIEELREAAGFEPNQKSWDFDMLPDPDLMVEACKGLVIWDRDAGIVRFAHHTVRQFLLSDAAQEGNLKCTQQEAELHVGKMCLTYLLFSDFDTQIQVRSSYSQAERILDIPQAGPANWLPQMLDVPTSTLELPLRFLGLRSSSSAPDIDYAKYLRPATKAKVPTSSQEYVDKYRLLQYVIDNWVFHTKWIEPSSSWTQKLRDLAMYKTLPFEFRPWGPNKHYGLYGCVSCRPGDHFSSKAEHLPFMSLFHYAAEVGHWLLMEPLVTEYSAHEKESVFERIPIRWDEIGERWLLMEPLMNEDSPDEKRKDQVILIAVRNGHQSIVEHLTPTHGYKPIHFAIMINAAASSGQDMLFGYLLNHMRLNSRGGVFEGYIKQWAHITLAYAAANGHQAIVKMLWQNRASVNEEVDELGETPISAAAANGHDHVVRFLISKGARQLRKGTTPLHRAARNGHVTVTRTLLQLHEAAQHANEVPPNVMDRPHLLGALDRLGETPLHQAARSGHYEVMKVMLEHAPVALEWRYSTLADTERAEAINSRRPPEQARLGVYASLFGRTLLELAAKNGHLAVVILLCDYQPEIDLTNGPDRRTLLNLAAKGNHIPLLKWLLLQSHHVNLQDDTGFTALHYAVIRGHEEAAQILLECDPSLITRGILVLAAQNIQKFDLDVLIQAHRKHVHSVTTKKLLFEASKKAQSEKLQEASQFLKEYCEREIE